VTRRGPRIGLLQLRSSRGHGDERDLSGRRLHETSGGRCLLIGARSGMGEPTLRDFGDAGEKAVEAEVPRVIVRRREHVEPHVLQGIKNLGSGSTYPGRKGFNRHVLRRDRRFKIRESHIGVLEIAFGLFHRERSHAAQVHVNQCLTDESDSKSRTRRWNGLASSTA